MLNIIQQYIAYLFHMRIDNKQVIIASYIVSAIIVFIVCIIVDKITKKFLIKFIKKMVHKTKNTIDEILYEKKVFHSLAHIAPAIIIYLFSSSFGDYDYIKIIQQVALAYIILIVCMVIIKALDATVEIYRKKEYSKGRPIKGIIQVVKIFVVIFGGLFILVVFTGDTTAKALLGGVGGISAVLLLIFKDSILGLVAGIQLSSEKLLSIGDWIEMPKYNADGEVIDISLTKITIRNWDKTFTTIPAYKFLEDSFKNWEGMSKSGGRRIKRSINVDMKTIGFLTEEQIAKLSNIELLKDYISHKVDEIKIYNEQNKIDTNSLVNGRRLSNIGTFRAYILEFLKQHPLVHKEGFTLLVRQLSPTEKGLPIEIYCFVNDTAWATYEGIQSDIFDHLLSVIGEFDLQVYQNPSGTDITRLLNSH